MIAIRGFSSAIAQALLPLLSDEESFRSVARDQNDIEARRHLFCQGILASKNIEQQSESEILESFMVNAARMISEIERIIEKNDRARICIVGSESGFAWSFDGVYAASKAAVHRYVETKKLRTPEQQLICIAPTIISNAGMTTRRKDFAYLNSRAASHPKGRFLTCSEVAGLIYHVLYVDEGYLSGVVIRMNGGAHTQMGYCEK